MRNIGAFKRLDDCTGVVEAHRGNVLQEWDKSHQDVVVGVSLPLRKNDSILRLFARVGRDSIDEDDLRKISIQVGEILLRCKHQTWTLVNSGHHTLIYSPFLYRV